MHLNRPLSSDLLYRWVTPVARLAKQRQLQEEDLPLLPEILRATRDSQAFEEAFQRHKNYSDYRLVRALLTTYKRDVVGIFALSLVIIAPQLCAPLVLREILRALKGGFEQPGWFIAFFHRHLGSPAPYIYPLACSLALVVCSVLATIGIHRIFFIQPVLAKRVMNVLSHEIFVKALRQHRSARTTFSSGQVVNLVGTDCQRISTFLIFMHSVWYHPIVLTVAVGLLYELVGTAALWGAGSLVLILACSAALSRIQGRVRKRLAALADVRVNLTRETLLHIKAAKLQGWEQNLAQKIQAIRVREAALARTLAKISSTLLFLSALAPAVAIAVATTYMVYHGDPLNAETVFPMLALFTLLRFAIGALPETLYNLIDAGVSLGRIQSFLLSKDCVPVLSDQSQSKAISLRDVTCYWPDSVQALSIPEIVIQRGELVVVVGSVGSGKSSLLLTILGELTPSSGTVSVNGRLAYVAQHAWIVSDSIRDNILSGLPFDAERYRRAVRVAGLAADLASFPHGDATEIGERGINLSGGQRHRVALARAVYREADIFLFDDPLSALDPDVANHVFTQLIAGELASTTRVIVSHRVEYALAADRVIVIEDGTVVEQGTPTQLQSRPSRFSELLHFHEQMNSKAPQAINHVTPAQEPRTPEEDQDEEIDLSSEPGARLISTEERVVGAVKRGMTRDYLLLLAPGGALILLVALFLSRQVAAVSNDLWLTFSSNSGALNPSVFLTGYCATIAFLCVVTYFRSTYILTRGLNAGLAVHKRLLHGVLHAQMRFFESNPVGRILNRFSRDLETVELHLPRCVLDAGSCLTDTLAVCVVVAVVTPPTLLIIIPVAFAYLYGLRLYRPISRDAQRLYSTTLSPVFAVLSESLSGVETIRASQLSARFTARFDRALESNSRVLYCQTGANRWVGVRLELLGAAIILGVSAAISLNIDAFAGIAFSGLALSYASSGTGAMNWAVRSLSMMENSLTSYERMQRYAEAPPEAHSGSRKPSSWPAHGTISIKKLSVRYRPELPFALSGITCEIPGGSRVGIIGRTGSGKSTLTLALMRLIEPHEGTIEIDGVDLTSLALNDLRNSIAVVPQEPVLFSGTLRENLDPFSDYSDAQIMEVLRRVELWNLYVSFPAGLSTEVHEGGFNFSSGQRQLICLARALLRQSKVVVLDEATASIDVETDYAIQRALREQFKGSTVLVIAHRLGTVIDSDLIVTLRDGELVEFGKPEDLLAKPESVLSRFVRELQSHIDPGL